MLSVSKHIRLSLLSRQLRSFHISPFVSQDSSKGSHSADHYFKDVDTNPPSDPTLHRVDEASENALRPHDEPPSGPWSQAGTRTGEYQNVAKEEPYDVPGNDRNAKTGYGGVKNSKDKAGRVGAADEGPDAEAASGRK